MKDLFFYKYPSDQDMEFVNIRIVYLGYFMEDFTSFNNAEFAVKRGLKLREDGPEENGDITKSSHRLWRVSRPDVSLVGNASRLARSAAAEPQVRGVRSRTGS